MKPIYYTPANRPDDEEERQRAVDASGFSLAIDDPMLIEIVRQAAALFGAPMAAVSIVDNDRQWFPAEIGIGARETVRAASFCAHAILEPGNAFCVPDATEDDRFAGNPLVLSGPTIRFYAGAPLLDGDGRPLGALCVLDDKAREAPDAEKLEALVRLARHAIEAAGRLRTDPGAAGTIH